MYGTYILTVLILRGGYFDSYQSGRVTSITAFQNGNDTNATNTSFNSPVDEVCVYDSIKYTADFTPPTEPYTI